MMKTRMLNIRTMATLINVLVSISIFAVCCTVNRQETVLAGMVLIPAGEFEMGHHDGAADERPPHPVYVHAFYIDTHEVTNAEYKRFVDANIEWQKERIDPGFHDGTYLRP